MEQKHNKEVYYLKKENQRHTFSKKTQKMKHINYIIMGIVLMTILVLANAVSAVVSVGGTSTNSGTQTSSPFYFAKTIPSGSNLLLVGISIRDSSDSVSSVKWASDTACTSNVQTLTSSGTWSRNNDIKTEIWQFTSPTARAGYICVTLTGSPTQAIAGATDFKGVDTTTPTQNAKTNYGTIDPASVSPTSSLGNMIFGVVSFRSDGITDGQTTQWNVADNADSYYLASAGSNKSSSATSTTMSWTHSGDYSTSPYWSASAVEIKSFVGCGDGVIQTGEQCDDGNTNNGDCCSSTCQYESSATVCRASAGVCDVAETCTGASASCPTDTFLSSSTVCRLSAGQCDIAETCSGSSASCPADVFQPNTVTCTGTSNGGACDGTDKCLGTANTCVDKYLSGKQSCSTCLTCSGSSSTCSAVTANTDPNNDCTYHAYSCKNSCTRVYQDGNCDGAGACGGTLSYADTSHYCSGGSLNSGACDSTYKCTSTQSANDFYGVGTGYSTQGYCDGTGSCDRSGTTADDDLNEISCGCRVGSGFWNLGGEVASTTCCGFESGENKRIETPGTDAPTGFGDATDACCNANTKCVQGGSCVSTTSTSGTIPNKGYCNAGTWEGGDAGSTQCVAIVSSGYWNLGGEGDGATACCGDDSGEYKVTRVCNAGSGSGCSSSTSDDACCAASSSSECVYNSVCYNNGWSGISPWSTTLWATCSNGQWIESCSSMPSDDSDTGDVPQTYGSVKDYTTRSGTSCQYSTYNDVCSSTTQLTEYYNNVASYSSKTYTCTSTNPREVLASDLDGDNPAVVGTCTGGKGASCLSNAFTQTDGASGTDSCTTGTCGTGTNSCQYQEYIASDSSDNCPGLDTCTVKLYDADSNSNTCTTCLQSWSIGGEVAGSACCGDDSGEYTITSTKGAGVGSIADPTACCDTSTDCAAANICTPQGQAFDADADGDTDYCSTSNNWIDCNDDSQCSGSTPVCSAEKICVSRLDGQACTDDSECVSGSCKLDYDNVGKFCAGSTQCVHDGAVYDDNDGAPDCFSGTQRRVCSSGIWTSSDCNDDFGACGEPKCITNNVCDNTKYDVGTDCGGTCQSCDGNGACINTPSDNDYQNECNPSWTGCSGLCTKTGPDGNCDGSGACKTDGATAPVAVDKICSTGSEITGTCDDDNFCSETDHCDGSGSCVQKTARDCSDEDDETFDRCDESAEVCVHTDVIENPDEGGTVDFGPTETGGNGKAFDDSETVYIIGSGWDCASGEVNVYITLDQTWGDGTSAVTVKKSFENKPLTDHKFTFEWPAAQTEPGKYDVLAECAGNGNTAGTYEPSKGDVVDGITIEGLEILPEPATLALLGLGLASMAGYFGISRRKR